ncbi:histidine triad nucleotide binding protein [Mycobacterium phage Tonenili]|uniref:Histidine triad nucleotide binding protein n=1 Tax=Mycobacterium phage Tonenili TaxID=1891703 RepID=A0A1C9EH07_9CAUD|nr:histidine triad nucleotide binding protein [Mycobacterium phage Tonenili]AON96775.1 histidine triad nucleotide binding protein [Mycobacterium phage Tonenili]
MMSDPTCVFCPDNWDNLDILHEHTIIESRTHSRVPSVPIIQFVRPLNPVTEGHLLVIHREHTDNAADGLKGPTFASECMHFAAGYVRKKGIQANIITSIGPAATQTVMHTHLHIVPRTEGDKLLLPWTLQQLRENRQRQAKEWLRQYDDWPDENL